MTSLYKITFRGLAFLMFFLGLILMMNRGAIAADLKPDLKPDVHVTDGVIRMQDLVDGKFDDAAMAGLIVANAPAPGQRTVIAVQDVANLAYKHGIALTNSGSISRIIVERDGVAIPQTVIETSLEDQLGTLGLDGQYQIRMSGQAVDLSVPVGAAFQVAVDGFQYDAQSHRFQARLTTGQGTDYAASAQVYGFVVPVVKVPVLSARVQKSDIIRKSDINWVTLPEQQLADGIVTDAADLIGMSPKRTLQPGQPVRQRDIGAPLMIAKGAMVTIEVSAPGLTLTAGGRAIEDGSLGDVVRIVNADTHQTITAQVTGPNRVAAGLRQAMRTAQLGN